MDSVEESRQQRAIVAERERLLHLHNEQYERALHAWALSSASAGLHWCYSVWRDSAEESWKQRAIDEEKERLRHLHNEQYERAIQAWALSNASAGLHWCYSVWRESVEESWKQRAIDEEKERLRHFHNEQ